MSKVNPGRLAALRALLLIEQGVHADEALAELAPRDGVDRGLAWHLTLGVLRRCGALDTVLARFSRRPIQALDPVPRNALRIGLFEGALSRTAAHAAVDQAVEACRAAGQGQASGFVNAILRRAIAEGLPDDPFLDLPPWLAKRWADWGDWVARLAVQPPLSGVAARPGYRPAPDTEPAFAAGQPVRDAFVWPGQRGAVEQLPGFAEGLWWVMDPSAAAVADLVIDAVEAAGQGRGARVLDAAAAPGGKSLRMRAAGCEVLATDASAHRLERVREGASRTGLHVETAVHDWLVGPMPDAGRFAAVLVDAPCTGLGIVRRHPEIRWLRHPTDPAAMALRQLPILRNASHHVAPGGALVYAVCSPFPEEGQGVVERLEGWRVERAWCSTPPQGDEDAFQAFVLRRAQ